MKSVPTPVRSLLVLTGLILVTFRVPLPGMCSPPGDWYASAEQTHVKSAVMGLRSGVDGAPPDDDRRRVAGIFLALSSCKEDVSAPPPTITDTAPVGDGLKVIGFSMLGAAVVIVLGRMLK